MLSGADIASAHEAPMDRGLQPGRTAVLLRVDSDQMSEIGKQNGRSERVVMIVGAVLIALTLALWTGFLAYEGWRFVRWMLA